MSSSTKRFKADNTVEVDRDELPENKKLKMDADYFENYSDITIHADMLSDKIRTNAYRSAILKNYKTFYKKTVLDVGAGTGILSLFCVQAGARKVYAIEASDMAEQTRRVVKENGMEERIEVINCKMEDAEIPEKVDVIVSEWMGYNLLYESMLESVLNARDRFLKEDGCMFPERATLHMAPVTDEDYEERLSVWTDVQDWYKVNMKCMIPYAKKCMAKTIQINCIPQECIQSRSCEIFTADLKECSLSEIHDVRSRFDFRCFGHATIHGFVTWFDVDFPGNITLTTSPYEDATHWAQTVFHLKEPMSVEQDTQIKGSLSIKPNSLKPRFLDISISYKKNEEEEMEELFLMDNNLL